jgi:hypothetical protein
METFELGRLFVTDDGRRPMLDVSASVNRE